MLKKERPMKKKSVTIEAEELLPHYDFKQMPIVKRGPGYQRRGQTGAGMRVTLDPELVPFFPDEQAVNEALRTLIRLVSGSQPTLPKANEAQ